MQKRYFILFTLPLLLLLSLFSCKKDALTDPNFQLGFSTDTLSFDTVFVTIGSTTKFFAIRNEANNPVTVSEMRLEGGDASNFRINIDGVPLPDGVMNDVTIPANDSIYIFVEVTVDPNTGTLPFLIEDRILFETNSNEQQVVLQAYGQNAHFFKDSIIGTQTWTDDLPYVILNSILIEECATLTIEQGVDIYFGGGSAMFVAGQLNVMGNRDSTVTFRGIRLDDVAEDLEYDKVPGQWNGIYLLRNSMCRESLINHAEIRNAQFGIIVGTTTVDDFQNATIDNGPILHIENSVINNHSVFGLLAINATITARNLLMYQAGSQLLAFQLGGDYNFEHCTFYNRGSQFLEHQDELLFATNAFGRNGLPTLVSNLTALNFLNCILYGSLEDEIVIDTTLAEETDFNYNFNHCLLRSTVDFGDNNDASIFNLNPLFFEPEDPEDAIDNDFRLSANSPCIDKGNMSTSWTFDFDNNVRNSNPDIGAYEYIP